MDDTELTEEESKNINDFEETERGVIIKSRTGSKTENSCYGK